MSISDMIVVMRDGIVNQIDNPQRVYDDPVNLFVAKFLGTPPINVFEGRIENGRLYIGDDDVGGIEDQPDRLLYVGIRPEGFILDQNGPLKCTLSRVEVMGRDTSIISTHPAFTGESIRSIISSEIASGVAPGQIRFSLRPSKVLLFDKESENRVRAEVQ